MNDFLHSVPEVPTKGMASSVQGDELAVSKALL